MGNRHFSSTNGGQCGGYSTEQVILDVAGFCEEVKDEVQQTSGKPPFEMYKPLKFRSQVVKGYNYLVKIQISQKGECVHIKIFRPLPKDVIDGKDVVLEAIQTNKTVDDPISIFNSS